MNRRILIVNETPIAKDERAWLEARSLAHAGYEVRVICPKEDRTDARYRNLEGVHVHTYSPPSEPSGLITHAWELAYCWLRSTGISIRLAFRGGFDVVHACNPPDTFFALAAIHKPFGKKFVFAQHDLVPELWFSRYGDRGRIGKMLHRGLLVMERLTYVLADVVIVPNESYKRVAMERGRKAPGSVFVVRNGPDLEKVRLVEPDDRLKCGRKHLVCYLGIMNPQDGVDYLLYAASHLVHEHGRHDTQFAFVGSGDILGQLQQLSRELKIEEYCTFTGWVSDSDILSTYLRTADVCVAPDPKTPLNEVSSFMKIMDYMAVERPIVAFDLAETRVSAGESALYAVPDDIKDLAEKISQLLDDPARCASMGRIGRERIENGFSWRHQEALLLSAYEAILPLRGSAVEETGDAAAVGAARPEARPRIAVDVLDGKRHFLEFWGLPYKLGPDADADVSMITADSWEDRPRNALVSLAASGAPGLYRTDDGLTLYAPVRRIENVPEDMELVTSLRDDDGKTVSFILHDPEAHSYYLPFSLDDVFDGFLLERYTRGHRFPPDALLSVYYAIKPLIPATLLAWGRRYLARIQEKSAFPQWPIELSLERLRRLALELLLKASRSGEIPFIWFWPAGHEYCLVLTHDVEKKLADNEGIWRLIDAEKAEGFRSSFNVVPFKYPIDNTILERLREEGCEVGVHGYSHDGTLFRDETRFPQRAREINEVRREWGAAGFRSASTYRVPEMLSALDFEYDLSFFDTDPYEPQPGGCLSLFPFFVGDLVEIPMTLPQDYTLFTVRNEPDNRIWREKIAVIREMNGLACLNAHPDEGYMGDQEKVGHYLDLLRELSRDRTMWNPLAGELANWWRRRKGAFIVGQNGSLGVEGGAEGMHVRWAHLVDGQLAFAASNSGRDA